VSGGVEGLYRAHHGDIYRFLARELGNAADAEDATQTVFVNAHRSLLRGCVPTAPRAWLYAIARNVARRTWRERCERPAAELDLDEISCDGATDELRRELVGALEALPERQREALVLHELGGLEYAEIAQATNQSVAGVETAIFRARRACRAELSGGGALDHEAASKLVGRFVAGKLTRQEREALQKHIATCPDCEADERERRAGRRSRRGLLGWLLSLPEAIQRAASLIAPSPSGLATAAVAVAAAGGAATLPSLGDGSPRPSVGGSEVATAAVPASTGEATPVRPAATASVPRPRRTGQRPARGAQHAATAIDAPTPVVGPHRGRLPSVEHEPGAGAAGRDTDTSPSSPDAAPTPAAATPRQPDRAAQAPQRPREAPIRPGTVGTTVDQAVDGIEQTVEETTETVTTVVEQTPVVGPVVDTVTGGAGGSAPPVPVPPLLPVPVPPLGQPR
jgi:RNA polymerase sigma-70 factor (ECF subfamily)